MSSQASQTQAGVLEDVEVSFLSDFSSTLFLRMLIVNMLLLLLLSEPVAIDPTPVLIVLFVIGICAIVLVVFLWRGGRELWSKDNIFYKTVGGICCSVATLLIAFGMLWLTLVLFGNER